MNYHLSEKGDFIARMLRICDKVMTDEFDYKTASVDEELIKE